MTELNKAGLEAALDAALAAKNLPAYGDHKGDWVPLTHAQIATAVLAYLNALPPAEDAYQPKIIAYEGEGDPYWQFVERDTATVTGMAFATSVEKLTDFEGNLVGFTIYPPADHIADASTMLPPAVGTVGPVAWLWWTVSNSVAWPVWSLGSERPAEAPDTATPLYTSPPVPVTSGVAWQPGERELALRWIEKLSATLSTKPDHADDEMWLERLAVLFSASTLLPVEEATGDRNAVLEEAAGMADGVRQRLTAAARNGRLNQIDEHVAGVADDIAKRIRALKSTPADRNGWVSYFSSLSPDQQKAVLAYKGDDTVGETMLTPVEPIEAEVEAAARAIYALDPYGSVLGGDISWDELDDGTHHEGAEHKAQCLAQARSAIKSARMVGAV